MSYRNLEIWQMARELVVDIHRMTLEELPSFERYEEGSQIRRAIKSARANIVEGYGRRRYRQDYIRFLVMAHASCDEAKDHLEVLRETGSLSKVEIYEDLHLRLTRLSKAIHGFTRGVERDHLFVKENSVDYDLEA